MIRQAAIHATDVPRDVPEPTYGYLVCTLRGGLIGFDVTRIRDISAVDMVLRLPLLPDYVKGITSIRGRLILLLDLRLKLGLPEAAYHTCHHGALRSVASRSVCIFRLMAMPAYEPRRKGIELQWQ